MATQTRYATKDAFMGKAIGGSFSGWNGQDNHLPVGVSSGGTFKWRSVISFNIDFSVMDSITDATLYLYDNSTGSNLHSIQSTAPSNLIIDRMTSDWGEGGSDPGEGNLSTAFSWDWDNRYNKFTANGETDKSITQGSNGHEQSFDTTDIVTSWFNGSPNYGFMIRHNNETDAVRGVQFYAREAGGSLRPKLVITYTTNTAPLPPTLTSPIGTNIVNTLTPTLSGSANDADAGDYITGVQVQVGKPFYLSRMKYSSTTSSGDPGSGFFRLNNATATLATTMYISETDLDGYNIGTRLDIASGKYFYIWEGSNILFALIGTVTDNGAYRTIGISTVLLSGSAPSNNDVTYVMIDAGSDGFTSNTLYWDSGQVGVSGSPTTFSTLYGSTGSPTALSGNNVYVWRAKTKDKGNEWSLWQNPQLFKANSSPNIPTVTIVSTPSSDISDDTPDFTIVHNDNDPGDTKMYAYQVVIEHETSVGSGSFESTGGWDSGQIDTSGAPVTSKTVTSAALTWGNSYRVKARTKDSNGAWSSYSTWQTFYIHKTGVPIGLDPSDGEGVSSTPTVTGSKATNADTIVSYQIIFYDASLSQIKDTGTLTSGITGGSSISYTYSGSPALTSGTQYYYKIRATGSIGGTSNYSSLQSFLVVDASVPTISAPSGTGLGLTPTITATRASVFNRIQYEIYPSTSTTSNLGTVFYASGTVSSGITGAGPTTYSAAYGGSPALSYATTYKIRARVSSDAGSTWSNWSGLSSFTTDIAGTPTLTSVGGVAQSGTPIVTDSTPDFVITRAGSDTIDKARIIVYNQAGTSTVWDSGMTDVANATTATITYAGSALVPGTTYQWAAQYQKTTGPTGSVTASAPFHLNAPPSIATSMFPSNGHTYATTDDQTFQAYFSDVDTASFGDTPLAWEIVVELNNGTAFDTQTISSNLVTGLNEVIWPGTAFSTSTDYRWKTRFQDSNSAWGAYSAYNTFRVATAPNGTFTSPSSGFPTVNTVNTVTPTVTWSYTGGTQLSYSIKIERTDSDGTVLANVTTLNVTTASASRQIPGGYLLHDKYYKLTLTVRSTDLLDDPTPSSVLAYVLLDAPDPITGLSATADEDLSKISLNWTTATLKTGHTFISYCVYRRISGDTQWTKIDEVLSRTRSDYNDWYAGNSLMYQYRVSITTTKTSVGVEMESPDDPDGDNLVYSILDADAWVIVGADRADEHIQEIPVETEEHNRPIQQEVFETLGSDRKVIVRGFVLGHEGTISAIWDDRLVQSDTDIQVYYNNTIIARRLLDYITNNKGPHILKSPFGDVWDVEFSGPTYRWQQAGHLEVDLEWVETGDTSSTSI